METRPYFPTENQVVTDALGHFGPILAEIWVGIWTRQRERVLGVDAERDVRRL
jgi:hypothetical protein